jgi:predicted NUDIX family NTP pyrophosphohydrolase
MAARGKESAGTLLFRRGADGLEVLIVRPSGPAARWGWSIPKGLPDADEALEAAARRETREEAGVDFTGPLRFIGHVDYVKSKKRVHCFAGEAAPDVLPRASSWEVTDARFVAIEDARAKLHVDQRAFLDLLVAALDVPR